MVSTIVCSFSPVDQKAELKWLGAKPYPVEVGGGIWGLPHSPKTWKAKCPNNFQHELQS